MKVNYEKKGTIFNIQKFSVNDGPGIRTVVFFKGCPLHCRWCSNPESQIPMPQILWDMKKCVSCYHCQATCSSHAISIQDNQIRIHNHLCNWCGKCITECPENALESVGEEKSVKEIIDIVLQDQVFYEESNGGITLSGGEFLAQPDFAKELLLAAKEHGLHTCCETTGFAQPKVFRGIVEYVDYLLFDMKHWEEAKHMEGTGVSHALPLINMKWAIEQGIEVLPRIPVIPNFNDSLADALELSKLLKKMGVNKCQLLPFHQFGENKYHLLGKKYDYENVPSLHKEDLQDYLCVFLQEGIQAFL